MAQLSAACRGRQNLNEIMLSKSFPLMRAGSRTITMLRGNIPMTPSEQIDDLIAGLTDWRGTTLAAIRQTILAADPQITEEWKWMGSPVWSCDGNIVVGNAHK